MEKRYCGRKKVILGKKNWSNWFKLKINANDLMVETITAQNITITNETTENIKETHNITIALDKREIPNPDIPQLHFQWAIHLLIKKKTKKTSNFFSYLLIFLIKSSIIRSKDLSV